MTRHVLGALGVAAVVLGSFPALARSQQGTTISGRVTSAAQTPLQNASVTISALGIGGSTDAQGRYSFIVLASRASGQAVTVTARRIGFQAKAATITLAGGSVTQDFSLTPSAVELTGVVVTALSQQREKATIGTSQQEVGGDELQRVKSPSVISALSGKVAGLQIFQSGNLGGSQRIIIRGSGSIRGENQPIFIVDGIPVSNAGFSTASAGGGRDYGTAISDLNMDDVASVTVLKGPNAAALYGSRASNGAVVITTKNGRTSLAGTRIAFTSRMTMEQPSIMPKYQNQYGQGFGGEFNYVDGAGAGVNDGADESWGPKLDGRTTGCVFKALTTTYDTSKGCDQFNGKALPWIAHPDNVNSYFQTVGTISNNLSVSTSGDNMGGRLSVTRDDNKGIVPKSSLGRVAGSLSANGTFREKLDVSGSLQYTQVAGLNRSENGYTEGNPFMTFTWFGRQVDLEALKHKFYNTNSVYGFADGSLFNWNDNYHRNPYWQVDQNPAPDSRDRVIASASANYRFTPWLTGVARGGADNYRETVIENFAAGNIDRASASYNGGFTNNTLRGRETNFEGILTARHGYRMFDVTVNAGGNIRHNDASSNRFATSGILVPGIYNLSNAGIAPTVTNAESHSAVNSSYGSTVVTVNRYWTVEATGRNDWSSTLPKKNASYFYPSLSSSLILSDLLPGITTGTPFSYFKLRGGWARVGSDAGPYQLQTVYNGDSRKFGSQALFSLNNTSANAALKPEQTTAQEGGVEFALLDDRLTIDGTYYLKKTRNQIIPLTIAPATGFAATIINAGQISNRGFESSVTAKVLRMSNTFQWNTTFNYLKNKSRVDELAPGLTTIVLSGNEGWSANIEARQGQPYGVIFGYAFLRDSATKQIFLSNGLPVRDPNKKILGNVNPDWTGGWANEFRYRRYTLNVLLDFRRGGQNFSVGNWFGTYAGVLSNTLTGRDVDWNKPGLTVKGLDQTTKTANTTVVTTEDYSHATYGINEAAVYNTGFTKLREVRFAWDAPTKYAAKVHASQLNLAFVGRNLLTWTSFPNYDPENSTNAGNTAQGFDMGAMPTTRAFGLNITITP